MFLIFMASDICFSRGSETLMGQVLPNDALNREGSPHLYASLVSSKSSSMRILLIFYIEILPPLIY